MTTGSFIDDLQDIPGLNDFDAPASNPHKAIAKRDNRPTYPCESCGGTGIYQHPRLHQEKTHCFACKGRGFFYKSTADRYKERAKRAQKKVDTLTAAKTAFNAEYPEVIEGLRSLMSWNNFAASLVEQYEARGTLSDRQVEAARNQIRKAAERDAQRAAAKAEREANAPVVDLANVRALFETAKSNGLKKPGLWFGDLKISEAPAHGANAGALYVKQHGEYAGKIVGDKFKAAWGVKEDAILPDLLAIAANPADVLRVKGKETGRCCCCGRELSDPESVAAGIGPICASKWGL